MLTEQDARQAIGSTVYSTNGEKIGKVGQLFLDDETQRPEFITVNTGLFGTNETFIPVADAELSGDRLTVPFDKDKVKDAPRVSDSDGHLSRDQEAELYRYYGLDYGDPG
ncbi:MAG: PRC-barrel domain-containing protein, partial [Nocardioidaceae bacterium]